MTKLMKKITFALLAPAAFVVALSAQSGSESPNLMIVINTEKPAVTLGSEIVITIRVTNISMEGVSMTSCAYHGNMPEGYHYDLRDEQGAAVPKIINQDPLRPTRPPGNPMPGGCGIKPGKSLEESATLSDEFNFDRPGKYTIRVWKPATTGTPEGSQSNRVYSNAITVTVLPAETNRPANDLPQTE